MRNQSTDPKYLYNEGLVADVKNINAYLVDAGNAVVKSQNKSISGFPKMNFGNMPADSGLLLFDDEEKDSFINQEPLAEKYFQPLISAHEFLNGRNRWCLWLEDVEKNEIAEIPLIQDRVDRLEKVRLSSSRPHLAEIPHLFAQITQPPNKDFILIPRHSSENRDYIPIGYFDQSYKAHDSNLIIASSEPWLFGVLTSRLHMVWVKNVGGRLKTDYRYSAKLCYNTFPFPKISNRQKEQLNLYAFAIFEAREKYSGKTMSELYDPKKMPEELKFAHTELDLAVERCYRLKPFESDTERLEYLFKEYEKLTNKN